MNVKREQAVVNQYHFDIRNLVWEKENGAPETMFQSELKIVERKEEEKRTTLVAVFRFMIVLEYVVISGVFTQANHVEGRIIEDANSLTDEEKKFLNEPLVDMLQRMTYDVTEIAFDAPGLKLELK